MEWIANEPWIAAVNPTGGVRRNEAGNVWVQHSQSIRAAVRVCQAFCVNGLFPCAAG